MAANRVLYRYKSELINFKGLIIMLHRSLPFAAYMLFILIQDVVTPYVPEAIAIDVKHLQQFILKTYKIEDVNPIHKTESDSINVLFKRALLTKNKKNCNIEKLFRYFYENSTSMYDDSYDIRRFSMRRSMLFATLAICADEDRDMTFIAYAKYSLKRDTSKIEEHLAEQFLRIIVLRNITSI